MNVYKEITKLKKIWGAFTLRFRSDNFIIIVDVETNEYKNVYAHEFNNKDMFDFVADALLEPHPNYEK